MGTEPPHGEKQERLFFFVSFPVRESDLGVGGGGSELQSEPGRQVLNTFDLHQNQKGST